MEEEYNLTEIDKLNVYLTPEAFKEIKLDTYKYYDADPDIKNVVKRSDIIDAFTMVLLSAYKTPLKYPLTVLKQDEELEEPDDYTRLFEIFEVVQNSSKVLNLKLILNLEFMYFLYFSNDNLIISFSSVNLGVLSINNGALIVILYL